MNIKACGYSINGIKIQDLKSNSINWEDFQQQISQIQQYLKKNNINYFFKEQNYHFKFEKIYSSPYIIYWKGNPEILNYNIIAIVGPRRPSNYSCQILEKLFEKLQNASNLAIISGLAPGVDSLAHRLSIQAGLPTIAILGGGFNHFLKNKQKELDYILSYNGLILSEFKLFQKPEKYTFPQRNRIIAGLADLIFVPEAGEKSGSLITVDFGLKMKKEIWGATNSIFISTSKGLNKYISEGKIKAIWDIDEFVNYLNNKFSLFEKQEEKQTIQFSSEEKFILEKINQGEDSLTKLNLNTGWDIGKLMMILTNLEMKGVIKDIGGRYEIS